MKSWLYSIGIAIYVITNIDPFTNQSNISLDTSIITYVPDPVIKQACLIMFAGSNLSPPIHVRTHMGVISIEWHDQVMLLWIFLMRRHQPYLKASHLQSLLRQAEPPHPQPPLHPPQWFRHNPIFPLEATNDWPENWLGTRAPCSHNCYHSSQCRVIFLAQTP